MRFLTFGEIMLRLGPPGNKAFCQALPGRLEACFGGAEANAAVVISALGGEASFATVLPEGPIGDACLSALRSRNVGIDSIRRLKDSRMGIYFLEQGACSRPSRVIYDREHSAFALSGKGAVDWDKAMEGTGVFHVSGISPAVSRKACELTVQGLENAKKKGITISVDLNFRSKLWKWDKEKKPEVLARETMTRIVSKADILFGNEEDAQKVFGMKTKGLDLATGSLDPGEYERLVMELSRRFSGLKYIALSLRYSMDASRNLWGGLLYDVGSEVIHFHPAKEGGGFLPMEISSIVDRVGAGDAFAGGILFGLWHMRYLPAKALAVGVSAGALAHTFPGDWFYSNLDQVEALASGITSARIQR